MRSSPVSGQGGDEAACCDGCGALAAEGCVAYSFGADGTCALLRKITGYTRDPKAHAAGPPNPNPVLAAFPQLAELIKGEWPPSGRKRPSTLPGGPRPPSQTPSEPRNPTPDLTATPRGMPSPSARCGWTPAEGGAP